MNKHLSSLMIQWHHAIHQVTGDMAKYFGTKPDEQKLRNWASQLSTIAKAMRAATK